MVFFGFSQTHKAVYSLRVEANPITGDTFNADITNPLAENNELYLYFDNNQSYYTSYNVENNRRDMSDAAGMSYYPIKYSFKDNSFQKDTEYENYSYKHMNNVDWTLTNETKQIGDYSCIKAVGILKEITDSSKTFQLEAWFAPEVAFPVGPGNYAGLPGMIVYLIFENYYIFKLESIKFNDNSFDFNSIEFKDKLMTKEQYIEYLKS